MNFSLPLIEWIAVITAIIYILLAAKRSQWCWLFAIVSSCLIAWQSFNEYHLIFDAGLNLFYAVMGIIGYFSWEKNLSLNQNVSITKMQRSEHFKWISLGIFLSICLGYIASRFEIIALPWIDAFTTVFCIIGTVLMIQSKLENWLYLLLMDVIYIGLFYNRGSLLFSALYVVYSLLAVKGFFDWKQNVAVEDK